MDDEDDPPRERVREADRPATSALGSPITLNEFHALLLGLSGVVFGASSVALESAVGLFSDLSVVLLILYALTRPPVFTGLPGDPIRYRESVGLRTISTEPWWFVVPLVLTYVAGRLLEHGAALPL